MEKKMKRRSYVRIVSFVAALAAVLVTASICGNVRASKYKRQITLSQQRALTELDGRLREIGTSLKKGVYSSTPPMLSGMASEPCGLMGSFLFAWLFGAVKRDSCGKKLAFRASA